MVNKVILIGNLGRDPEIRYTQGGQPVANFTMATSERWNNKDGERQERTEWHKIVVWGKLAEFCGEYLSKGRQVYAEGRLQTREWEDKDGNKRWTTEVVANAIQFVGPRPVGGGGGDGDGDASFSGPSRGGAPAGPPPPGGSGGSGGGGEDDIPF